MRTAPARTARRRRRPLARALLLAAAGVLLFAFGIALGEALEEGPATGTRTEIRTLRPATVAPPPRTVTVTVTGSG